MSDAPDIERVIERVRKLFALSAERGASENEATLATKLAQELLVKHNLDMAVIEAAASKGETTAPERVRAFHGTARFRWQRELARQVAEAHFCYYVAQAERKYGMRRHTTYTHLFVGRRGNVTTAQLMFSYLTETIESLVPIKTHTERFSNYAVSWKEGCSDRLCERLAQKRQDLLAEHDARIRAESEAREAAQRAKYKAAPKQLKEDRAGYVKRHVADLRNEADIAPSPDMPEDVEPPDVDSTDAWDPSDLVDAAKVEQSTSLVLAFVYDASEQEANYEVAHNLEPGSLRRYRDAAEKREEEKAAKEAAEYVRKIEEPIVNETMQQRYKRLKKIQAETMKSHQRYSRFSDPEERAWQKRFEKRDHSAYHEGADAGRKIGLDTQVTARKDMRRLK